MRLPTIRENDSRASEHERARWWRLHVVRLSIEQLAEKTGYSERAIYLMENGITSQGKKVKPWVWHRFKLMCAAVEAELRNGRPFNWGQR